MQTHLGLLEKWEEIVKRTGHDIDKFAQAMWDEVYSKVDLSRFDVRPLGVRSPEADAPAQSSAADADTARMFTSVADPT